jgi:bifunctional non-homologous end joining protein LigD
VFDPLVRSRDAATWRGAFVIHQHDATHLHYDLRLEMAGALLSFALPKGPTLDPEVKHFAMQTEDHPIEYLDFEAVIPEGTYGAGPMIVWDLGVVRYLDTSAEEGLRDGKLHFQLEGRKVWGRFGLVRMKPKDPKLPPEWLFIKKADAGVSKEDITRTKPTSVLSGLTIEELRDSPRIAAEVEREAATLTKNRAPFDGRKLSPMLCQLAEVPKGTGYLSELKMDGVRVVATKTAEGVELRYRSGRSATSAYPEIARAVAALPPAQLVLDGEVVAFDEAGKPNFERLATRIHRSTRPDIALALSETPVVYMVFDLLRIGDVPLLDVALRERKRLLARLIRAAGLLRVLDHLEDSGQRLFDFCRQQGLEGIVSKRADSRYHPGPQRTADWVKTKCEREDYFVVVGYTVGEGSRNRLGALDLASFDGTQWVVRGKVGSGLNDARVDELRELLKGHERPRETAVGGYDSAPRGRSFVEPFLVVRVRYLEWSEEGALRFPVFLGVEPNVRPEDCRARPQSDDPSKLPLLSPQEAAPSEEISVRLSNQTKVFWPDSGQTKGDLVEYYRTMAPVILPYLKDRPIMLVRYPDGIEGKNFYQWNVPHGMPSWVRSVLLGKHQKSADEGDATKHVFLIDRVESLLYIANLACIPIHMLGSRVGASDQCDFLTVDFDVDLSTLENAVLLAHTLREILEQLGLVGFPKTSGQSGLHVFVPLGPGVAPEAARVLTDLLGRLIVDAHPTLATVERVVARRGAKVYVDTGQTGPSRTIVAPYSVRATKGARVSTPLRWSEVVPSLDPAQFTITNVPARVAELGDPMAELLAGGPDIQGVMAKLAKLVR